MKLLIENFKRFLTEAKKEMTFEEALEQVIKSDPEKHKIWTHWEGFGEETEEKYKYHSYADDPDPKKIEAIKKYYSNEAKEERKAKSKKFPPQPPLLYSGPNYAPSEYPQGVMLSIDDIVKQIKSAPNRKHYVLQDNAWVDAKNVPEIQKALESQLPSASTKGAVQELTLKQIAKKIFENPGKPHIVDQLPGKRGLVDLGGLAFDKASEERVKYLSATQIETDSGTKFYFDAQRPPLAGSIPFAGDGDIERYLKDLKSTGKIDISGETDLHSQRQKLGMSGGRPKSTIDSEPHRVASEAMMEAWKLAKDSHQDFWDNVRYVHWITYGGAGDTTTMSGMRDYIRKAAKTGKIDLSTMAYSPGSEMTGTKADKPMKGEEGEGLEERFGIGIRVDGEPTFATRSDAGTTNPVLGDIKEGGAYKKLPVVYLSQREDGQWRPQVVGGRLNAPMYSEDTWRNPSDYDSSDYTPQNEVILSNFTIKALVIDFGGSTRTSPKTVRQLAMLAREMNVGLEDTMGRSFVAKEGEKEADLESYKNMFVKINSSLEEMRSSHARDLAELEKAIEDLLQNHDYDLTGPFLKTVATRSQPESPERRRVAISLASAYLANSIPVGNERVEAPVQLTQKIQKALPGRELTRSDAWDAANRIHTALHSMPFNKENIKKYEAMLDDMDEKIEALPDTEKTREWRELQQKIKERPPTPEPIDIGSGDLNEIKIMFSKFMKEWV